MDFFLAPMFRSRERMHPELGPNKFLMARVGYLYNRTPESTTSPAYGEHTIDVEMTPRFYLPAKVLATDRNRGDLGFSQGEFKPRYRNRLQFERSCETGRTMSLTADQRWRGSRRRSGCAAFDLSIACVNSLHNLAAAFCSRSACSQSSRSFLT